MEYAIHFAQTGSYKQVQHIFGSFAKNDDLTSSYKYAATWIAFQSTAYN